jgi:hypothetical protein
VRFALGLIPLAAAGAAWAGPRKELRASPRGAGAIAIDGRLDEAPWRSADVASGFVEREPVPGRPAPIRHAVRVLFDEGALYVGIEVGLLDGEVPRALEMNRDDFTIFEDDVLSLKLDVRRDRRTTVGFATNVRGTQFDYVALENGVDFRAEYDAVWEVETSLDVEARTWAAEFRLPVAALGLAPGTSAIGFQVTHDHNTRNATYDWAPLPPEFGPMAALYYGEIDGLEGIGGGAPITLIPYVRGSLQSYDASGFGLSTGPFTFSAGGDARLRVAEDTWMELTVLPDFAQTDLDDPVVNFNRFPLFRPERRPFFLTGLQAFDFGMPGVSQPFFSRRIGLDEDGRFVPVWAGLKAYGRAGPVQFGAFEVLTGPADEAPGASFTIARVRNNFDEHGHIGAIGTLFGATQLGDPAPSGGFRPAYTVGVDGSARLLERRLEVSTFWIGTRNTDVTPIESGTSGVARIAYRGDVLQAGVTVLYATEGFDPRIGFVTRTDVVQATTELVHIFRFGEQSEISQLVVVFGTRTNHSFDALEDVGKRIWSFASLAWKSGWNAYTWAEPYDDVVEEAFDVLGDQRVEPGRYRGITTGLGIGSPSRRNPYGAVTYSLDTGFFGGKLHTFSPLLHARLGPHVEIDGRASLGFADREGFEKKPVLSARGALTIAPTIDLSADVIVQVNSIDGLASLLARVRWRYLPGSDLFLVYREGIPLTGEEEAQRDLTLKLQYRFDTVL